MNSSHRFQSFGRAWCPVFLFFVMLSVPSHAGLRAFLGYSAFWSPASGPYVETHLYVLGPSVVFKRNLNGLFQGALNVSLVFKQHDSIRAVQKYTLHSQEVADTVKGRLDFIDQQRFFLPEGEYDFEIRIGDENSNTLPFKWSKKITISFPRDQVGISDIEFLESFSKSITKSSISKNGYDLVPYVSDYYPDNMSSLSFYCEVYPPQQLLGDSEKFVVFYSLKAAETNRIVNDCSGFSRQSASSVNGILGTFDIRKVPSGNYNLFIEVRDRTNKVLMNKSCAFQRKNTVVPINLYELAAVKTGNSFVMRITNRDSLIDLIRSVKPIAETSEKSFIDGDLHGTKLELLQQFFLNFWKSRNEQHPELEWNTYAAEVRKVNGNFGSVNQRGYNTDRGRVYLQYGPPDNRIVSDNEVGVYPYEIWQYYKLKTQSNRRFIFYNPDYSSNNYVLLHSDARGEVNNDQWEAIVNKRSGVNGDPGTDNYGSRTKQNFLDSK